MTIHLISGQHLPNASERESKQIIEPYVKLSMYGHPTDQQTWEGLYIVYRGSNVGEEKYEMERVERNEDTWLCER